MSLQGTGMSDPYGSRRTGELAQPILGYQAPHKEGDAGPERGQNQSPTKILLWRGRRSRNLTNSQTGLVLISGNLMGKARSNCPLHSQGAVAAPHFSCSFSLPSWKKGPTFTLPVSSRSSSWSSRLFLWDSGFLSSVSSKAPGALPAHRQEEKRGSDGKELPQPRGGERG